MTNSMYAEFEILVMTHITNIFRNQKHPKTLKK